MKLGDKVEVFHRSSIYDTDGSWVSAVVTWMADGLILVELSVGGGNNRDLERITSPHPPFSMNDEQVGRLLRKKRGDRSLRDIALAAGITPRQVQDIEQARTAYTFHSLLKLAKAVGVKIKAE